MCALVMLLECLLEKNAEALSPCVGQAVMERLGPSLCVAVAGGDSEVLFRASFQ
jgi:hypothetical protein